MCETDRYDYELPPELIAQHPVRHRSDARLLLVDRATQAIEHWHVRDLPELLTPADCLVLNDTRVLPARLVGYRQRTGGKWQGLFLSQDENGNWEVMAKTRGKQEQGESIVLQDADSCDRLELRLVLKLDNGHWVCRPSREGSVASLLGQVGRVPLPPYIRGGEMLPADVEAYQTVFAENPGSVAAPTAGLHFTDDLLGKAAKRGIGVARVTLHVGVGTFRPVSVRHLSEHRMHSEWGCIGQPTVDVLRERRAAGGRVVAVGTTAVRVLESAAVQGSLAAWEGDTDLFIRPPFRFQAVDGLMTNFHLPRSTLLVLVRCFGGDELIRKAYDIAIADSYRFFSYGDAMLIL